MIPIAKPYIGQQEKDAVAEVLESGILASGPKVTEFENKFADYVSSETAAACSSGTAGLCAAVAALPIPENSKILTTPFSFIATANCILYGNHTPVFCDVDENSFNMTPDTVKKMMEADKSIKAIIPVHLYGQAAEIDEITNIAHHYGVYVIEDAAQAHGATDNGKIVGAIGDLGVFSFYPTKNMAAGEGGMVTGKSSELVEMTRLHINHGAPVRYKHTKLGFNYRMTSIAAAIGLCQLERLPEWNRKRYINASKMNEAFKDIDGITIPYERTNCQHVYHQYVLKVQDRESLQDYLKEKGIGTDIHYPRLIPEQDYYLSLGYNSDGLDAAKQLTKEVLSLPVHPAVSEDELNHIIASVKNFYNKGHL